MTTFNNLLLTKLASVLYDPLEQFELSIFFDLFNSDSLFFFMLAAGVYFLIEKSMNMSLADDFMKILMKDLTVSNLPEDLHYFYYMLYPFFMMMFSSNISGLFFFSYTETAVMQMVFLLSSTAFFGMLLTGMDSKRSFFLNLFLPQGTPAAMLKLLMLIEMVSYATRLMSLALSLLANMMSGHMLLKMLIGFIWIFFTSFSFFTYFFFMPWMLMLMMLVLEILMAFLQSYVFVFLCMVFMKEMI